MAGGTASAAPAPPPTAVVVAGDEETRVLLRGLLRLHHCRVLGEAGGAAQALDLLARHHPALLIADVNLSEGSYSHLLQEAKRLDSHLRIILVAPSHRSPTPTAEGARSDAVLYRPFRIREFAEALATVGPSSPPVA